MIVKFNYARQAVFIKHVLTHAEYDRERWKDDC
ncbi:MAG: type II toxin-antitoxin system HigB family toxin [Acidobacteria bacterium]|nr:type II toxin-antitoxin system HigB family toxin [Acidobacteriota bacterium]MBI3427689.1 type II toxin-antitoxin system HigB family toxin [Acidobacteriota bacterium]